MPLLNHSRNVHVASNTGMPRNTHTIMHEIEQYMFCKPGLELLGKTMLVLDGKQKDFYIL